MFLNGPLFTKKRLQCVRLHLSAVMYVHPVCTPKHVDRVLIKTRVLRESGFWFMDGGGLRAGMCPRDGNHTIDLPLCTPLAMRWPRAEAEFERCQERLAWQLQ